MREGEVPVTLINRDHREDDAQATNQLAAARETIQALSLERARAERSPAEAEARIRHLETKLAHELMARDEAMQRGHAENDA